MQDSRSNQDGHSNSAVPGSKTEEQVRPMVTRRPKARKRDLGKTSAIVAEAVKVVCLWKGTPVRRQGWAPECSWTCHETMHLSGQGPQSC